MGTTTACGINHVAGMIARLLAAGVGLVALLCELLHDASLQILRSVLGGKRVKGLDCCSQAGDEGPTARTPLGVIVKLPQVFGSQVAVQEIRRHLSQLSARQLLVTEGEQSPELTKHDFH